ncbi:MAG: C45 family peptidase [Nanoarchaeota archaeon]|nr:C45 family peptidase [Nanoarchaeota archaeon]
MKIPLIEAEGSNYDIGFIIGKKLKSRLKALLEIEEKNYKRESGKYLSEHVKSLQPIIKRTQKHFPNYIDELRGMSEGSGIGFNPIFALGCEDDLAYNCTSIAGVSKDGILLGHNEDWLLDHLNSLFICQIKQKNKSSSISLGYIGHLPGFSIGMNSSGLAYTGNSLHFKANKNGIPLQFSIRALLDVKKYSDLIKLFEINNRMIGENSLMVFRNKIFDVEMTPKTYDIISGRKYLAHTNHVLSKKLIKQETRHSQDTIWRLDRANKLLENNKISIDLFKKILSDHTHRPHSICCHEYEKRKGVPYATIGSAIVNVTKGEFYIAHGNPCKSKYIKYKL